jgi:GT2 family glycosyltransferase
MSVCASTVERDLSQSGSGTSPHVYAVVLVHNGRDDTLRCLASLLGSAWRPLTIVIVDNGSEDGAADAIQAKYPGLLVLRQDHNLGFAEGNNIGIRYALEQGADYVLLLNNDTTVAPDAITRCVEVARSRSDAAAVCPLILFTDPPNLIWYAGAAFDPQRARSGRVLGYRQIDTGQRTAVREADRATGAAVLIPSAAFERIGLLAQELFFLYEDVDWSLRARGAGYKIYVAVEARVWHRVSASAGGEHSAMIAYYDTRNHLAVCQRHAPLTGVAAILRELGIVVIHLAGARRAKKRARYIRAVVTGWRDARRGRMGPLRGGDAV